MKKHSLYKIHKSKPFKFCFHIYSAITVASSNAARSPARCVMVGRGGGRAVGRPPLSFHLTQIKPDKDDTSRLPETLRKQNTKRVVQLQSMYDDDATYQDVDIYYMLSFFNGIGRTYIMNYNI